MFHPATRRVAPGLAGAALLVASLTACGGGGDSAPEDASQEEFCQAFTAQPGGEDGDPSVDQVHDYADELAEVGTPEGLSGDARQGFEVYVDYLADVDQGDIDDLRSEDPSQEFSGEEEKQVEAFLTSDALTECVQAQLPDLSDVPTDLPTDLSTPPS